MVIVIVRLHHVEYHRLHLIAGGAPKLGGTVLVRPYSSLSRVAASRVAAFARRSNASMVVLPGPETISHRELITTLAARHKLPAVYPYRYFVTNGGLICYGPDELQQHRQAAGHSKASVLLSAFGVKRTCRERRELVHLTRMTRSGHRPDRNLAMQQPPGRGAPKQDSEQLRFAPRT